MNLKSFLCLGISLVLYHIFTSIALPLPKPFPSKWNLAKTGVLYRSFYRFQGSRYPNAAHYWPFNSTSNSKSLLDVRGKCKTLTYNGVRTTYAEQLGPVVSLDGLDDWIFINGVRSKCINDPTLCSRGLTIAFWIKYHAGEFILSGGRYTDHQQGPGFRFICSNCPSAGSKASRGKAQQAKRFVLSLSTQSHEWKINLDFLPKAWFHFAFTWHIDNGLKVYKNGKLLVKDTSPEKVKYRPLSPRYETITLGRPNSLSKLHNYGKFDIGHLVIWPYELSAYEVEVAFLTVLAKTTKSLICCHFKKADPCMYSPCYNGATCRSIDEKFECICPDISQIPCPNKPDGIHPCIDRSDDCAMFASQEGYCNNDKKSMSSIMCAKTCKFCGIGSTTVLVQPAASRTQNQKMQTLSPTPTPYPTVSQPHFCPLGSKQQCVCMNCEGNTAHGLRCCVDLLHRKDMDEGIIMVVSSLSMMEFLSKVTPLRNLASEIINDQCSKTPCFQDSIARRKRSRREGEVDRGTPSSDQIIQSWDGSPIIPSNTLKPDSRRNAQPASMAPRIQKPVSVDVVIFKIAQHPAEYQKLYTAFYVSVNGTNETQILKADTLAKFIRAKRDLFKEKLNISIDFVAPWSFWSRTYSIGPRMVPSTAAFPSSYGTTVIPGAGTPNVEGQEGNNSTDTMSKSTFIIVLVTGIGGFVVLAIIIIYVLVKFLRRMKGEFVPDKVYPNEQKSNSGSDQLIPSFIDPSTPRITDVPKKTVRTPVSNGTAGGSGQSGGGGGGGGAGKKVKKPMGVKVTYKPPKWD